MEARTCTKCGTLKSLTEFAPGAVRVDGTVPPRACCKACVRANSKKHYETNTERYLSSRRDFSTWLTSIKSAPCTDCRNSFPAFCMDFDHVRGKKMAEISKMGSWDRKKVLKELDKCELVCANCHRIRTFNRREPRVQETA